MNTTLKDLVAHMKSKAKHKIQYEKLDPNLVNFLNEINENDIQNFHTNNFLKFENKTLKLIKYFFKRNSEYMKAYGKK